MKFISYSEGALTFKKFWRSYNVREALCNISGAWVEVKCMTMNGVQRKVWEDCIQDLRGFEEPVKNIQELMNSQGKN